MIFFKLFQNKAIKKNISQLSFQLHIKILRAVTRKILMELQGIYLLLCSVTQHTVYH